MYLVRRLSLVLGLIACMATAAAAASPVSVSLFPPIQIVPPDKPVSGLRLNIIYGRNTDVTGLDWGLVNHATGNESAWMAGGANYVEKDFTGWQDSFVNVTRGKFTGLQSGWFNQCGDGNGVEVGIINVANNMRGLQFGVVNLTDTMHGLQVGLGNVIRKGKMPFLPIVNWSF